MLIRCFSTNIFRAVIFRAHYRHATNAMSNARRKPKNPRFQGFFIRSFSNLISDRRI
ncbi:hypothetical protein XCM_4570 [Xanthomonas citri pv. mangiferaeindicae]|nr:hypothetical protein XCM_4570 [Xanthomonas citri pv. mangiferaeindicae]